MNRILCWGFGISDTLTIASLIAGEILANGIVNLYKMLLGRKPYSRTKGQE